MPVPILATKLYLPPTQHTLVPRPRLIERFHAALQYPVTLISAPAGSGKTSAVRAWIAQQHAGVAWLSLDPEDNDPARFWSYVLAALHRLQPDLAHHTHAALEAQEQQPQPIESVLTMLLNELVTLPDHHDAPGSPPAVPRADVVLALDDYHLIDNPAIHRGIAFLIDHLPPHLHLLIASRSDPPLPLARLRVGNQLAEVRFEDLRFTAEEAALFLNQIMELQLTTEDLTALETRTEGWIAGLQLAALSLQGRDPAAKRQFIAAFSGSQRYILDYLVEEVLAAQPERTQQFLLQTSVLDYLLGSLCDALTGQADGQAMLESLERANLFLFPLDEERRWYRYHHLFAKVLRLRLQRADPAGVPVLHRKAAQWYDRHSLIEDAVHHALVEGDPGWTAHLIERYVEEILHRGEGETLRRWLAAVPREVVRERPRLLLAQALAALNIGQLDEAESLLEQTVHASAQPAASYTPTIGRAASIFANTDVARDLVCATLAALRGDAAQSIGHVDRALRNVAEDEHGVRVSARWSMALADWMRGNLVEAEQAYLRLYGEAQAAGEQHSALGANALLAGVRRSQGRLSEALRTYQDGLVFAASAGASAGPTVAMAYVGMAQVCYQRNQLDQALRYATAAIPLGQQLVSTLTAATGLATLAWVQQALGDPTAARAAMEDAYRLIPTDQIATMHNPVPAERARFWLAQGDLQAARGWVTARGVSEADDVRYPREREYLVFARLLLAQNMPDRALSLLERIDALAQAQGRIESVIEARALAALVLAALGERAQALAALRESLALARPEGYIRIFVDEGAPMSALLRQISGELRPYAAQVLAAIGGSGDSDAPESSAVLIEPLTERELEVLRALAAGLSNRAIAQQLYVSVATVKVHLKHIYGKLAVSSRTEALARAHTLRLL